jgi:hypothetical protein
MKIWFTLDTRPSSRSGTSSWRRSERMLTLTMSTPPLTASSATESG